MRCTDLYGFHKNRYHRVVADSKAILKKVGIGCGALVLLCMLGFGACLFFIKGATDPPANRSHAFFAHLREQNVPTAWTMLSPSLQARVPLQAFQSAVTQMPPLTTQTDSTFTSRSIEHGTARLSGYLTTPQGEVNVQLRLTELGGLWVIDSLSVMGQELQ